MSPHGAQASLLAAAATVVVALGVCAIGASVMAPALISGVDPWVLAGCGFLALLAGLLALWVYFRLRDRSLW
jgi:protein-S-isoprenylcysteine O-methyltransferase Ste14